MCDIVLLDTSVYLNVINVPGFNQHRDAVLKIFELQILDSAHFLLPLATVLETGNHIAGLTDGQMRRRHAQVLVSDVNKAFTGEVPYRATYFPDRNEFLGWLREFPERATERMSLADLTIVKEWGRSCVRHPMTRVRIWSLDESLSSYDRQP